MNESELMQMLGCLDTIPCGGIVGGLLSVIGGLFGSGHDEGGGQQPVAPDVTQSQDQKAAAEEQRRRQLNAQRNGTTATSGLGTQTQASTTSNKLG